MQTSLKNIIQLIVLYSIITMSGLIVVAMRFASFGLLTDFNRKYIIANSCKLMLQILGMNVALPDIKQDESEKCFYTFNHNSYFDVVMLAAMGLTNAKFIISEKTIKLIPITLVIVGIGGLYIPMQEDKQRRLSFFLGLEKKINEKKFSIIASSEGVHIHHHGIDKFNRGVYHIATVCNMKIVPLFINISEESNPLNKYKAFSRGCISIDQMESINTTNWKVEDIDKNKEMVRNIFVKKFNQAHHKAIC
jgi:1-acyl-sn-glycerol-3-phosphate acyltransferase